MIIMELKNGFIGVVDDEDKALVDQGGWYAQKSRNTYYIAKTIVNNGKKTTRLMHREIMKPDKGLVVDHINRIGLDNRRNNLRVVTSLENTVNRNRRGCVDEYIHGKWRYRIVIKKVSYKKHGFNSENEARQALHELINKNT